MATRQFEPMTIGGILDRTFTIYRENFVRFLAIAAVVYVPIGLLTALSTTLLVGGLDGPDQAQVASEFGATGELEFAESAASGGAVIAGVVGFLITIFLSVVGKVLASGALLRSVSEYYLGKDVTVGEAYRYVLPKLGTLIWAGFLVGVVIIIGYLLLVVPGIIFSLWFTLVTPAIVLENLRASEGMSRSKALASGNLGKIFGTLLVVTIIAGILGAFIGWVGTMAAGAIFSNAFGATFVSQLMSIVAEIVAAPISAVAMVLLYYDLRIRKEGFDLEMMARDLAIPEAQPYAPAPGQQI